MMENHDALARGTLICLERLIPICRKAAEAPGGAIARRKQRGTAFILDERREGLPNACWGRAAAIGCLFRLSGLDSIFVT